MNEMQEEILYADLTFICVNKVLHTYNSDIFDRSYKKWKKEKHVNNFLLAY